MAERLRDAHLHLAEHGEQLASVDLSACRDVDECLSLAAPACVNGRFLRGDWIVCERARPSAWREGELPARDVLDELHDGTPLVVRAFDHHSASANTMALERAGLLRRGEPTHREMDTDGRVWEGAYNALTGAIPERSDDEERACVLDAQRDLMAQGFDEVHDMHATGRLARTLSAMEREGLLELRVVLYATPDHFRDIEASGQRVVFGGLKLFTDGTLSGRTASMLDPYVEPIPGHPRGCPLIDDDTMMEHLRRAHAGGYDVACHAIGDGAVRRLLDFDERLAGEVGGTARGTLRLEHAQFVHPDDIARLAERAGRTRRIVVSPQPSHLLTDIEAVRRYTAHAEGWAFPLRSIVEAFAGAGLDPREHVELGSDTPIVRPLPADTILGACARRREGMGEAEALSPAEAIGEDLAWSLYRAPS